MGVLDAHSEDAMVVAGGTRLTIMLRQRLVAPGALVSINDLPGADGVEVATGASRAGALVIHRRVDVNPIVRWHLPVVPQALGRVADMQVRNAGTVGGVMAESDYASDPPTLLTPLAAEVEVAGPSGARTIPTRNKHRAGLGAVTTRRSSPRIEESI